MEELFTNDINMRCRDSKGRFATPERAYADRVVQENKFLRLERERYKRSYFAAADLATHWQRKYLELREKVKAICK
jgi:hypothetical protein